MYNNETKDKFVELRAAGKSFGDISQELGVVKSTLHRWEDERADDIARLRRIAWEETEAEIGYRLEEQLSGLACDITDFQTILNGVNRNKLSVRETLMLLRETRREYFRVRGILMGTSGSRSTRKPAPSASPQYPEISNLRSEIPSSAVSAPPRPCVKGSSDSSEGVLRCPLGVMTEHGLQRPVTEEQQRGSSKAPEESNETERSNEIASTQSRNTNDLQQSVLRSFDFCPPLESETSLDPQPTTLNASASARVETQNQTFSGLFLDQKEGGSTSEVSPSSAPAEAQNPTFYPPFIHQNKGGSSSDPFDHIHNGSSPAAVNSACVETQNPAKTLPFTSQNSGGHNSNLSPVADLEGEAPRPLPQSQTDDPQSQIANPKSKIESPSAPSRPGAEIPHLNSPDLRNTGSGAIGNSGPFPHLKWPHLPPAVGRAVPSAPPPIPPQHDDDDPALQGESLPISPYETTREWLERQGITVSKIPKGARIISAG